MSRRSKIKPKSKPGRSVQEVNTRSGETRSFWPWLIPVLVLTGICFLPILTNTFTNWDDDVYITRNRLVKELDWKAMFTDASASNYHPLTMVSLALNYAVSGTEPFSYYLINWLLHILNTALVFLFIYNISGKKVYVAAFTSLIFGIHPMHVESVAWIAERKDVLYTFFFLLSLIWYWRFLEGSKRANIIYCFVFFVLSLLSKPAAVILPIVLLLLDYWKGRLFNWKIIAEKMPFFLLSLVFGFITVKVQSADAIVSFDTYPLWTRFFFACYTVMIYAARFFVPYPLSAFHPYPPVDAFGLSIWLSPVFIIALVVLLWLKRKDKLLVFSILFFIVNLLLVVQFVSVGLTIVSERYTYVPYIGLAFLAAMWLEKYLAASSSTLVKALPVAIAIAFGIVSFQRTRVWKDGDTLWGDVIKKYPAAPTPRSNHANFLKSMATRPEYKTQERELLLRALEDCNVAIRLKPTHAKGYENRQNIYLQLRQDSLALSDADSLIRLEPKNTHAFYTKGVVYMRLNRPDSALSWFDKAIAGNPHADWMLNNRGSLLFNNFQRYNDALNDFNDAIAINPQGEYFYHRSLCYYKIGDIAKARADAVTALQKGFTIPGQYRSTLQL
ncbi:MAG TPA: tetratricopeptide repeat protein [Chitinophagaceae bacterium]